MVFSLFELNELKERVDSVRFANSALSRFEDVEVKGFDNDVEHVGSLIEAKVAGWPLRGTARLQTRIEF